MNTKVTSKELQNYAVPVLATGAGAAYGYPLVRRVVSRFVTPTLGGVFAGVEGAGEMRQTASNLINPLLEIGVSLVGAVMCENNDFPEGTFFCVGSGAAAVLRLATGSGFLKGVGFGAAEGEDEDYVDAAINGLGAAVNEMVYGIIRKPNPMTNRIPKKPSTSTAYALKNDVEVLKKSLTSVNAAQDNALKNLSQKIEEVIQTLYASGSGEEQYYEEAYEEEVGAALLRRPTVLPKGLPSGAKAHKNVNVRISTEIV